MTRVALFATLILLGLAAEACVSATPGSQLSKSDLLSQTPTIVLAQMTDARDLGRQRSFSFRTIEVLKGQHRDRFTLVLDRAPASYREIDFNSHKDRSFWDGSYDRLPWRPGMCTPTYDFVPGGQYLLFLENLDNGASAERIKDRGDLWYKHVRERTKGKL